MAREAVGKAVMQKLQEGPKSSSAVGYCQQTVLKLQGFV